MMGVILRVSRGGSKYWSGCICILVGVSVYIGGGASIYW